MLPNILHDMVIPPLFLQGLYLYGLPTVYLHPETLKELSVEFCMPTYISNISLEYSRLIRSLGL